MLSRITSILHRTCAKPTVSKLFATTCTTTVFSTARSSRKYVFSAVLGGGLFLAVSRREDRAVGFESLEDMAPLDLPGRPHNLTETEKAKLKEMWATAFRVFGVPLSAGDAGDEVDQPNGVSRTPTIASETKEKKGGKLSSMFKKKKDKESTATLSDGTPDISKLAIGEGEDKYSQTKEFKEALATSSPKEIHDTFWKMVKADHPDSLFLRFLRARKWDVSKAIVMLVATMHWRSKEMDVEKLVRNGELYSLEHSDEDFLKQMRLGKSFLHGLDIHERPICVVRTRLHHSSDQQPEALERFTVWEMETARLMLQGKVDTACVLFDMTGFSLSNMDYPPVKFLIRAFEAHYPESLGVCLVHKAPWIFQGIWNIIKGWLDPVVASKIHFTRSVADLEKFIPRSQIIKELEGEEQWEYKYVEAVPGENDIMLDTDARDKIEEERGGMVERFEEATRRWIAGENTAPERDAIASELNENYWRLDPYIRARTFYDRLGEIGERGGFIYQKGEKAKVEESTPAGEVKVSE